jgi:hypothetical protein
MATKWRRRFPHGGNRHKTTRQQRVRLSKQVVPAYLWDEVVLR